MEIKVYRSKLENLDVINTDQKEVVFDSECDCCKKNKPQVLENEYPDGNIILEGKKDE